ncbi:MAG: recombinase family protein [Clostridia bacterium]|nr:recombinase family protein [Clostridia bacterium]
MREMIRTAGLKSTPSLLSGDVHVLEQQKETPVDIKVAAYCRVSTDKEIQQQSLDTQMAAYNKVIEEHPGWVLAGIYADKGISGTTVRHREEFKRMIEDAKAGKIQYILAKSISRFARNTVDTLAYVRELKSCGVSVFFEKEKLDTGNAVSEFLLSIFAASAQEEIFSLSNNMKVGKRMRYAAGIAEWTHLYGYRCAEDGTWVIDDEEGKIVKRIFEEYTSGCALPELCRKLMDDRVPSPGGKQIWLPKTVGNIIHNEKYAGDLRMQKTYISDPIQHIKISNRDAKLKQYYKENHHKAIVDHRTYQIAQMISTMKDPHRGVAQYPYYGFLKCPICGQNMVHCAMPRNSYTFAWTCGGKASKKGELRKHRTACPPYYIIDDYIDRAFWDALRNVETGELYRLAAGEEGEKTIAAQAMLRLKTECNNRARKVEYKDLCDTVKGISFPQWTIMKVDWNCGVTTSAVIDYKKVGDMPYPTITKEEVEHTTLTRGKFMRSTYVVNGMPLVKSCPDIQIRGIMKAREAILQMTIQEPLAYEAPVPRVYGARSKKNKEMGK